jgi:hypothetical protein
MPDIKYVKGSDNVVADALSRRVDLAAMHVSSVVASSLVQDIPILCAADPTVVKLVDEGTLVFRDSIPYTVKTGKMFVPEGLRERESSGSVTLPLLQGILGLTKCMS